MAPEFLPFIACGALLLAGGVGALLTLALFVILAVVPHPGRRYIWPPTLLTACATVACFALAGAAGLYIRQAFFLNEPMATAACRGNLLEVQRLLAAGASPNGCDIDCVHPALVCAAGAGHADVVRLLLERGAALDSRDSEGHSALESAREAGHEDVVAILEGANQNR